ncbi:MAG: periplasmic polysaccharide biosynthesis/export protein [Nitrospirae bacterium GWC2_42_7]|nr:MAG: periplasmic polysaccharide biosynthesis/export protein [Nitrospirae bacterium GWC2_42_7]
MIKIRAKKIYSCLLLSFLFLYGANISYAQDYIAGDGDVLRITVYDNPDLTTTARVSGEGVILFPLIGEVKVGGLTVSQVGEKIAALLSEGYVIYPQVTVFVEEFRSKKAVLMGQVEKPGLYVLPGQTTFLELLSKAGGLTKDAGDKAIIKRKTNLPGKAEEKIVIDLKKLIENGEMSLDILILDGDSIFVVKTGVFYVTGEVQKPAAYRYEENLTVVKAITMAGGFTEKASTRRIKIIRKVDGNEKVLRGVEVNDTVLPDDVIVVPESFF